MKLPEVSLKLPTLPKKVNVSLAVIGAALLLFVLLLPTLGAATSETENAVRRLTSDMSQTRGNLKQSKEDYDFVVANKDRFETLMKSDKLIPHTRRAAIRQMQAHAFEFGLTTLNYNFQAAGAQTPQAVANQPKSDDYRVYVEQIELTVGTPLDQNLYSFIAAIHDDFPGSMVVTNVELDRAPNVSTEALNLVSRGQESGLVKGKIVYTWSTAQQNKPDEKAGSGK
ncbi:MAG: hypothetical protein SFV19_12075 [Rhodospirillaceae bacterium]|nr:hypothetical protein [Rhodospirillaceae bacterium]